MIHIKLRIWNWNLEYETMKLRIIFLLMHRDSTGKQRVQKDTIHPSAEGTAVVSNVLLYYCPPMPWYWQPSAEDTAVVSNVLLLSSHAMILTAVCWRYCCGQQCPPTVLPCHDTDSCLLKILLWSAMTMSTQTTQKSCADKTVVRFRYRTAATFTYRTDIVFT